MNKARQARKKVVSEAGADAPAETLADKVAQDTWLKLCLG